MDTKSASLIRNVVNGNPDSVITAFLKATNFETASWKHTPWLIKELRGIADGSGQEYKDVFAFPDQISTTILKDVLRSKDNLKNPICRILVDGAYGFTFSSVLFTLGDRCSVQVTNGAPDQSEYKEYFFKK